MTESAGGNSPETPFDGCKLKAGKIDGANVIAKCKFYSLDQKVKVGKNSRLMSHINTPASIYLLNKAPLDVSGKHTCL